MTGMCCPFARHARNRKMIEKINALVGVELDYDRDVLPLSMAAENGGVTERHLMYALAIELVKQVGKGQSMIDKLASLGMNLSEKQKQLLLDTEYPFYEYDVLGMLKGTFVPMVFIDATDECPKLPDMVKLCADVDAFLEKLAQAGCLC